MGAHVTFVQGPTSYQGRRSPVMGNAVGQMRAVDQALRDCGRNFMPFVVIEDDVSWTNDALANPVIQVPGDADALYLGISMCAVLPNGPRFWGDKGEHLILSNTNSTRDVVRIYNMLGGHAIMFLTPAYAAAFCRADMEASLRGFISDTVFSRLQAYYTVYAVRKTKLFQDAIVGGQEEVTRKDLTFSNAPFVSSEQVQLQLQAYRSFAPLCVLQDGMLPSWSIM